MSQKRFYGGQKAIFCLFRPLFGPLEATFGTFWVLKNAQTGLSWCPYWCSHLVTVLWREEGDTMKYCLSPRDFLRAQVIFHRIPQLESQYSHSHSPNNGILKNNSTRQFSQKLCQKLCQKSPETVIYQSAWRGPVDSQLVPLPPINMAPVLQSFSCSRAAQL